jgi:hypothetical protein
MTSKLLNNSKANFFQLLTVIPSSHAGLTAVSRAPISGCPATFAVFGQSVKNSHFIGCPDPRPGCPESLL